MILYGYFRSTASWRVRIALGIKGIGVQHVSRHLRRGEQRDPAYLRINPQGFVPALVLDDGTALTQSLAICEYLDEVQPASPLLPTDAVGRARVRAAAQLIACDVHPLQNLNVLARIGAIGGEVAASPWAADVITAGLDAFERLVEVSGGTFAFGDVVTLADVCLVPQLSNARRFGVPLVWPRILAVERSCSTLPAFEQAVPDRQADAE